MQSPATSTEETLTEYGLKLVLAAEVLANDEISLRAKKLFRYIDLQEKQNFAAGFREAAEHLSLSDKQIEKAIAQLRKFDYIIDIPLTKTERILAINLGEDAE